MRYRILGSRDRRFDGCFFVAVTSTGIYCRPSCPAIVPKRENVRFYPSAAAAQSAGFRACLRCHPHAVPGSPEWNRRGDVAARAMALIADGVVDREGVAGLARRVAYSERHLTRLLTAELGAGPLALARAQRSQSARMLIQTSGLRLVDVAYAAGFSSVRQFNDTIRAAYGRTPTELRRTVAREGARRSRTRRRRRSRCPDGAARLPRAAALGAPAALLRRARRRGRRGGARWLLPAHAAPPAWRARDRRADGAPGEGARAAPRGVRAAPRRPARPDRGGAALPAAARPRRRSGDAGRAPRAGSAARAARARRSRGCECRGPSRAPS